MALKINDRIYKKKMKKLQRYVANRLPKETLKEFIENTPVGDTKNARRSTKLTKRRSTGFTIIGDYPYSGVIDRGEYPNPPKQGTGKTRGGYSTQAPKGIIEPTGKWLKNTIKDFIRRI